MEKRIYSILCVFVLSILLHADELAIEIDFSRSNQEISKTAMGSFNGVLPQNLRENYTFWNQSVASSKLLEENGQSFLRFSVEKVDRAVQFISSLGKLEISENYKIVIVCRSSDADIEIAIRQINPPYKFLWKEKVPSKRDNQWNEKTYLFQLKEPLDSDVGFLLFLGRGNSDLKSIRIYKTQELSVK